MYALPFLALFAPNLWVQFTFRKNDKHLSDMPFTGHEFGKKIIAQNELKNVEIESVKKGEHSFLYLAMHDRFHGRQLKYL